MVYIINVKKPFKESSNNFFLDFFMEAKKELIEFSYKTK